MTNTHHIRTLIRTFALCSLGVAAFGPLSLEAKGLNLDVLARDGYGVVQMSHPEANRLVVPATINGQRLRLLLDSGFEADGIAVDSNFTGLRMPTQATEERITATGKHMAARKAMAESVVMGNIRISGAPLLFGDFRGLLVSSLDQSIESRIHESTEANGYLTSGFLRTNSAIVDLHNLRLYLRPPGTGKRVNLGPALTSAGLSEASFQQIGHGACLVDVEVNGAAGKMFIDTGASLTCVDPRFAAQAKAQARNSIIELVDGAGVHTPTGVANTHSFKIGGIPIHAPALTMNSFGFYGQTGGKVIGLLGMDVLGQNWGIIDFGQQKLYFAKAP